DREVADALAAAVQTLLRGTGVGVSKRPENVRPQVRRCLKRASEAVPALEVEADGCRVERRTVVESHPVAQEERPGAAVRARRPTGRQLGDDSRSAGLELDQAFEHLVRDSLAVVVNCK